LISVFKEIFIDIYLKIELDIMNFLKGFDAYQKVNKYKYNLDDALLEALKISEIRPYILEWEKNGGRERYKEWFGNKWRIYLDIENGISDIQIQIEDVLKKNGYEVVDYYANKAKKIGDEKTNFENLPKIGRLLNRFDKDLHTLYATDKDVIKSDNEYKIVISRHPYDVVGMTTDRKWNSCMDIRAGVNKHYVMRDIKHGTLVAYVIKNDDLNINKPINRVLIKPFVNDENDKTLLGVEDKVYVGIYDKEVEGFKDTVENWFAQKQGDIDNSYYLKDTLYPDGRTRLSPTDNTIRQLKKVYGDIQHTNGFFIVTTKTSKLKGLMYENGSLLIKAEYDSLLLDFPYIVTKKGGLSSLIKLEGVSIDDLTLKTIIPLGKYDDIFIKPHDLFLVTTSDYEGIVNSKGEVVIDVIYDSISVTSREISIQKNNKYGIFDLDGKVLYPIEYDKIERSFSREYISLYKGDVVTLIRVDDDVVIGQFKSVSIDISRIIIKDMNDKYGMISTDTNNKILVPCEYDSIRETFTNDSELIVYNTTKDDKAGVIIAYRRYPRNQEVPVIIPCIYDEIFLKNIIEVHINEKKGILDYYGNEILKCEYDSFYYLDSMIIVEKNNKYGLVSKRGQILIQPNIPYKFYDIQPLIKTDYYVTRRKNDDSDTYFGVVNTLGEDIVPSEYKTIRSPHNDNPNYVTVSVDNIVYGLFSLKDRKLIVPTKYDGFKLYDDVIVCGIKGEVHKAHFYDFKGNIIVDDIFEYIEEQNDCWILKGNKHTARMYYNGKFVLD
jgi:hypothetical protein